MSHFRHPRFIDRSALPLTHAVAVAVNRGRDYFVRQYRHHQPISAFDNPYLVNTREHDLWFAAALTEASDLLDLMAAAEAAGKHSHFG